MGKGSVQSARVDRLVKPLLVRYDQIKKKRTFTNEVKARHLHIEV